MEYPDLTRWARLFAVGKPLTKKETYEVMLKTTDFSRLDTNPGVWKKSSELLNDLFGIQLAGPHEMDYRAVAEKQFLINGLDELCNGNFYNSWIGGPCGWLQWNGSIFTNTYNVGKYPSAEELVKEAQLLKENFPFLDMTFQFCEEPEYDTDTGEANEPPRLLEIRIDPKADDVVVKTNLTESLDPIAPIGDPVFTFFQEQTVRWDSSYLKSAAEKLN